MWIQLLLSSHVASHLTFPLSQLDSPRAKTPPPLTAEEMAPLPSSEAIFGKSYDQLKGTGQLLMQDERTGIISELL